MKKYINLFCLGALLTLAAARPWHQVNSAIGIRPPVLLADTQGDSMLITTPIQVVLPQATADSLVSVVVAKQIANDSLKKYNQDLDEANRKLTKRARAKKQAALDNQSLDQKAINALLAKQGGKPTADGDMSDLEKELNHRERPK